MKKIVSIAILCIGVLSCESNQTEPILQIPIIKKSKVVPPILTAAPIAEIFQINNTLDTILISEKGGCISIPKHCFITNDGIEVLENIKISFNEYLNPADILLSGIPMVYVDGEDTVDFQSAGMCKVLAYTPSEQLYLKSDKAIGIGLRSLAQDNDYNLYYMDTLKGEWLEREKNIPVILANQLPIMPINLQKTDTNDILEIEIEDYRIRPLYKMWHRSKFCVYGENQLVASDSSIWWYDMTINPTKNRDLYDLTFNGVGRDRKQWVYNLTVQPVIDSTNYIIELERFQTNMKAYVKEIESFKNQLHQNFSNYNKINTDIKANAEAYKALSVIQKRQDSLNMVNHRFEDSLIQVKQLMDDSLREVQATLWEEQKTERYKSNRTRIEVMRSFDIRQMGVFNCDRFYRRPIVMTKSVGMIVNNQLRQFDSGYLVDVKSNAVLSQLKFSINSYSIDLDLTPYVFVGILGGEVYMVNLSLDRLNEELNLVSMTHISISELKDILN